MLPAYTREFSLPTKIENMIKGEIIEALAGLKMNEEVIVFIKAAEVLPRKITGVRIVKQSFGVCGVLEVSKSAKGDERIYRIEK